jgi:hypothetical protein
MGTGCLLQNAVIALQVRSIWVSLAISLIVSLGERRPGRHTASDRLPNVLPASWRYHWYFHRGYHVHQRVVKEPRPVRTECSEGVAPAFRRGNIIYILLFVILPLFNF